MPDDGPPAVCMIPCRAKVSCPRLFCGVRPEAGSDAPESRSIRAGRPRPRVLRGAFRIHPESWPPPHFAKQSVHVSVTVPSEMVQLPFSQVIFAFEASPPLEMYFEIALRSAV